MRKNTHPWVFFVLCSFHLLLCGISQVGAQDLQWTTGAGRENAWPFGGGDIHNTRSVDGDCDLNPRNIHRLGVKWVFETQGDVSATPTVEGKTLYAVDWGGYLHAINAKSGRAIWSRRISDYTGKAVSLSRTSPAITGDLLIIGDQGDLDPAFSFPTGSGLTASVFAINKHTGNLVWRTVVSPHPFSVVTTSPVVYNGRVFVGVSSLEENAAFIPGWPFSFRGSIVCLDVAGGRKLWESFTAPEGYTGAAVWGSTPVVDAKRGSVYIATGNNYTIPADVAAKIAADPTHGGDYLDPKNYIDAVIAFDLRTGALKWGSKLQGADTWNAGNGFNPDLNTGPDYDFASGPNLFSARRNGRPTELLGAGQKSGKYWALDPNDGKVVWSRQVGPGGLAGGIQWGSAVDGKRVYVAVSNNDFKPYNLLGGGGTKNAGLWAGLDAATGAYLWQTPDPQDARDYGMVSAANGVVFAGSASGRMYAMDGDNGKILWSYDSGASVICGPSIVKDRIYWGTGYSRFGGAFGTGGVHKLFCFSID